MTDDAIGFTEPDTAARTGSAPIEEQGRGAEQPEGQVSHAYGNAALVSCSYASSALAGSGAWPLPTRA
jgi:hypothetical protein